MDDPSSYRIVGRLALAAFVMVAPTILFLGLVRGLERLQNDALVLELRQQGTLEPSPNDDVLAVLANGLEFDRADGSRIECPTCGEPNGTDERCCPNCLDQFSGP
ncbi:zinc ribbon domain-containing protein [Natronococcus sp. A-GB1]|uniref:zinc ribbon domain-containing protein n=1 Tax=Natronococcus sp. A-GB1 TaxID=3037648 RepID=UPI00241E0366|nr:zinc ribbon domain-containing protein [Natronococcus sp. A-GB1]MDG5760566.1 zinc ribbon domain-containing protein [Natronococcus sp. A-GB1]